MSAISWRKRFSILQNRLYLYPPPEPLPHTRLFWLAMGLVTLAVILFSSYFIIYLTARHDVYLTNAEDFGIMDQAIWNAMNGRSLHQTVCNILTDTNCHSPEGVNRFAIHFEPILFLVSLLYFIWSNPKMLIIFQTIVVALGAFPAFWLARLRLRNEMAGVIIALLYLLYPAQQQATIFDFHAVTLTASLLLFVLYFMYTRRTEWLFVFAILAMGCKEEIPVVIAWYGIWSMFLQRRWGSGLALVLIGGAWAAFILFFVFPSFSPTGQPLLAGRYEHLGQGPVQIATNILTHPGEILQQHVFEKSHSDYLKILLSPAAYLPLLAPWVLILALPSLAINLLTSNEQMYTGLFQYNAELVPVLIFATIEAMVLILWLTKTVFAQLKVKAVQAQQNVVEGGDEPSRSSWSAWGWRTGRIVYVGLLVAMLGTVLFASARADYNFNGRLPFSRGFQWPVATAHTSLAQRFIDMIPANASVSAQTALVPHLSQRERIYLFPYNADNVDYILLDVSTGSDMYPFLTSREYITEVKKHLLNGSYGVAAAQDGYLLLQKGLPAPPVSPQSVVKPGNGVDQALILPTLPDELCSYVYVSPKEVTNPLQVTYTSPGGDLNLIGFDVGASDTFSHSSGYMSVTTYWQVSKPITSALQLLFFLRSSDGKEYANNSDVPAVFWCQTNTWKPGMVVKMKSRAFGIQSSKIPNGLAHLSMALLPLAQSSSTIMDDKQARLPLRVVNVPSTVTSSPGTNALQLKPMTLVP